MTRITVGEIEGNNIPDAGDWSKVVHVCEKCGQLAKLSSQGAQTIFRRPDTGEEFRNKDLPVGAVYDATWCHEFKNLCGPDDRCLVCVIPGSHHWYIDSRASNCTMPKDNVHKCWVRHGEPEDGTLHVDKNGFTCAAGAGSIQINGGWHGFLHNGFLKE